MNNLTSQLPKILFVRHGQTDWNRAGRMQGQKDIPLNDRGRRQAERNGRVLKGLIGQASWAVAHSPLSRASETMQIILDNGVSAGSVRQEDDLREIAYGAFEGMTHREINQQFPDQMAERKADKWNFVVPDGESYSGLSKRTWAFLETLSEPTLIVAHGGVMRVMLQRLLNIPETEATGLHPPQNQILSITPSGSVLL